MRFPKFIVSALENAIYVLKGKKSRGEAAKDMAADIGTAGMVSGAVAFGVGLASTTVAGPAILAAAPVIGIVGMGIYGHSAYQRFKVALQDDDISPLTALPLYFHVECDDCDPGQACIELYATEVAFPFAHSRNGESPLA